MGSGKLCETCPPRYPSLSVGQWLAMMRIPTACQPLDGVTTNEIERAILRADEQIALYAGFWPLPTQICEEHEISVAKGRCRFTQAGNRGWITLRYGKVQSIDSVEFLRLSSTPSTGSRTSSASGSTYSDAECYTVESGTVCLINGDYGSVEINDVAVGRCGVSVGVSRVRIRYTAGECSLVEGFVWLLARLAASYLASPFLCGVDLRNDRWDFYNLTSSENEQTTETQVTEAWQDVIEGRPDKAARVATSTARTLGKIQEQRAPLPKDWYLCPFGPTRAGYDMWQYLKPKRHVRAWRM